MTQARWTCAMTPTSCWWIDAETTPNFGTGLKARQARRENANGTDDFRKRSNVEWSG